MINFTTCIYDDLHNSYMNGRLNKGSQYSFSLSCISKIGSPIYCFTDKKNLMKFAPVFIANAADNLRFVSYNLEDLPFSQKLTEIRKEKSDMFVDNPSWKHRCAEIMWGKFVWIKHIAEQLDDEEYLFWIDAGISHDGLIPASRYNSSYGRHFPNQSTTHQSTMLNDKLFDDKFPGLLKEYTGDKILNIAAKTPQHSDYMPLTYERCYPGSVIGGIFGGKVSLMKGYCDKILDAATKVMEEGYIVKEEELMTYILNTNPDAFKVFQFNSWYHVDWKDVYNPKHISFSDFFTEIGK